ncbi:hypothetical protein PQR02_05395 [Paraburkholderia sediminicola]|uniref:Uncharacterized protein n=1 Tax=Paraburkholderia rhynchosiae TaxID=487049 RepID=A0ACC7N751_9BURK
MAKWRIGRRIDRRAGRVAQALSRRDYTLQPARRLAWRIILWSGACLLSAVLGAAALTGWHASRGGAAVTACAAESVDVGGQQTELARARLALAEESAARAAVQKAADSAAAEVARLSAELQFLRGQSTARRDTPRR